MFIWFPEELRARGDTGDSNQLGKLKKIRHIFNDHVGLTAAQRSTNVTTQVKTLRDDLGGSK